MNVWEGASPSMSAKHAKKFLPDHLHSLHPLVLEIHALKPGAFAAMNITLNFFEKKDTQALPAKGSARLTEEKNQRNR